MNSEKVVYILDDDAESAEVIADYLRELSCDVRISPDGREGLELIREIPPDLIIMDLLLPHISGFDILEKVRRNKKTRDIKIIITTAFLTEDRPEGHFILVGDEPVLCTADYLTSKPVEKEKLFSVVENLLFGKEPANPDEAEPMLKILIVDDNQDNLFLLKNWLAKKNNIEILTSSNGLDAVALFETEKPEVVFLDIQMPGMNGIEVLEEIRSRDGNCTVIMMTAYGSEDIAVQSMKQGANDYLSKPIDYRRILKVLEENLEQARLRTKNRQLMEQLKAANRELYRKYTLLQEAIAHIEAGQEEIIKAQRISAITETAVSLNHEINNPLCSIMGNAELLGMMLSDADEKIRRKLEIITRESSRIHETTKKLSNLMEPVLTEYISGVQMIDLKKSK